MSSIPFIFRPGSGLRWELSKLRRGDAVLSLDLYRINVVVAGCFYDALAPLA